MIKNTRELNPKLVLEEVSVKIPTTIPISEDVSSEQNIETAITKERVSIGVALPILREG